jgi:hypothetical protein
MKTIKVDSYQEIPDNCTGLIEWDRGSKYWYVNGKRHRLDGPAVEYSNGDKAWYFENKLHRLDGPAWEGVNGYKSWWVEGVQVNKADHPTAVLLYKCKRVLDE